ncbi:MAG TPA: ABC transporter permease [Candidatus Angelobacter sp.]|nr:ABC transporter permease [Candidatus Angelobacter sp.]
MALWQDVRFALRGMAKARGLTAVALLTLAIGIGVNTAIFSIVNAVLLRPLPYRDPGQLVQLRADLPGVGATNVGFSEPELEDMRDHAGIFEAVSGVLPAPANLTGGEHPERIDIVGVSPSYFELLGATPQMGRVFDKRDTADGFADAVVISDGLWHRVFGGDPEIVGRKLRLDNDLYTVVGVMPPEFRHPAPGTAKPIDLWCTAGFRAAPFAGGVRSVRQLAGIFGRLKPGVTLDQARARLTNLSESSRRDYAADYPASAGWTLGLTPLKEVVVGNSQTLLLVLLLAVSLILLIACVNVASLLLARSSAREREIAVRMALGAGRFRIVRQLLTESAVLSLAAAAVGVIVAVLAERSLVQLLPTQMPRAEAINIDGRVLLFSLAIAVLTSVIFGLAPALQTARLDANALKQDGRSGETTVRSGRMRNWLVGAEVALSLTLVIGAGLLLRTFWELLHVHPGFTAENVLAASVWLPVPNDPKTDIYGSTEQRTELTREVVRRLHRIPGVKDAAITAALPLRNPFPARGFRVEGKSEQGEPYRDYFVMISPEFLQGMGATLLRGRGIADTDDSHAQQVALVDEAAARQMWGTEDPLGHRLRFDGKVFINGKLQTAPWVTVVGVVTNIKFGRLDEGELPHIYLSTYQLNSKFLNVVVRGTGDPGALGRDLQSAIQSVDPNLPVSEVEPMMQVLTASVAERRFAAMLIGLFAMLALCLAAVGVYGVASYSVQQRTRELGIRSALGASAADLVRMVLQDSMVPVLAGLVAGVVGAALAGRAIATLLFGVRTVDPIVYVLSVIVLVIVGVAANYIPARRAGKTDPNLALRYE